MDTTLDEQLERIAHTLGIGDDDWELLDDEHTVALLDRLTAANRGAILHLARLEQLTEK